MGTGSTAAMVADGDEPQDCIRHNKHSYLRDSLKHTKILWHAARLYHLQCSLQVGEDTVLPGIMQKVKEVLHRPLLSDSCLCKEAQPGHHCQSSILLLLDLQVHKTFWVICQAEGIKDATCRSSTPSSELRGLSHDHLQLPSVTSPGSCDTRK